MWFFSILKNSIEQGRKRAEGFQMCNYLINKLDGFNHGKIAPYVSLGHVTLHG
jgi:hypothetical protein